MTNKRKWTATLLGVCILLSLLTACAPAGTSAGSSSVPEAASSAPSTSSETVTTSGSDTSSKIASEVPDAPVFPSPDALSETEYFSEKRSIYSYIHSQNKILRTEQGTLYWELTWQWTSRKRVTFDTPVAEFYSIELEHPIEIRLMFEHIPSSGRSFFIPENTRVFYVEPQGTEIRMLNPGTMETTVLYRGEKAITHIKGDENVMFFMEGLDVYRMYIPTGHAVKVASLSESDPPVMFTSVLNNQELLLGFAYQNEKEEGDVVVDCETGSMEYYTWEESRYFGSNALREIKYQPVR